MAYWTFEDDCFTPEREIKLEYTGPNVFVRFHNVIRPLLERNFEVEAIDLWERDFRYDLSGDPHTFFIRYQIDKGLDANSRILFEVVVQGKQPVDSKKDGRITILISGRLRTGYNLDTAFKKTPLYKGMKWVVHRTLYNEIRRGYFRVCSEFVEKLMVELRKLFGMPMPERVYT
jgi:hypothetical protein